MKKTFLIITIIIIAIFAVIGASRLFGGVKIDVVHPVRGPAVQAVYATGTVEPTVMLPISPRNSARLMELNVDEGSSVTQGQVLAQLEDDELQHSIKQLQAREEFAKKEYERNAALAKNNVSSKQTFEQAKSEWQAAIEATRAAEAQADYLKLLAPDDGIIIKRDGEIGQMINSGTAVFWLSCCAPLRISAEVDEEDISLVKIGQEVLIRADAFSGQIFHGKVKAITPKGDPIARSYRVRIEFSGETPLQIGMTAETNIVITEKPDVMLIPSAAISNNKAWVVADGKVLQKPVTTGIKGSEQTEIIDGVTMDDMIIQKPDDTIKEGLRVRANLIEPHKP